MNKICVYAIAKNEEKNARLWYNSMKQADSIVVLDTGSEDNTVKILKELGVTVYEKKYSKDTFRFDDARNESLRLAKKSQCNIYVCTDLDERFDNQNNWADILRKEWNDDKHSRAQYNYHWLHDETGTPTVSYFINKIHSKEGFYWGGAVHEHLYNIQTNTRDFDSERTLFLENKIALHHWPDNTKDRQFYIDLIKKRVEENPHDYHIYMLLAQEYQCKGFFEEAIKTYNDIIEKNTKHYSPIELSSMCWQRGRCYLEKNNIQAAQESFFKGIENCIEFRENYLELAMLFGSSGLHELSIGLCRQALSIPYKIPHWCGGQCAWTWQPYYILALSYYSLGDTYTAIKYIKEALSYDSKNKNLKEKYEFFKSRL